MREAIVLFLVLLMFSTAVHHCTRTLSRAGRPPVFRERIEEI